MRGDCRLAIGDVFGEQAVSARREWNVVQIEPVDGEAVEAGRAVAHERHATLPHCSPIGLDRDLSDLGPHPVVESGDLEQ